MPRETGIFTQGELLEDLRKTEHYVFDLGGPKAYFTRSGGRMIGIFPDDDTDSLNALWTSPRLGEVIDDPKFWNKGGDRLWIGPEFGSKRCGGKTYFCRKPGNYDTWTCQRGMDPGNYSATKGDLPDLTLTNRARIEEFRTGGKFTFDMKRMVKFGDRAASRPVKAADIYFNEVVSSRTAEHFQAWKLLQFPSGDRDNPGTIIFGHREDPALTVYMNKGVDLTDFVKVRGDHVSVRTEGMRETLYKLAPTHSSSPPNPFVISIRKVQGKSDLYQMMVMRSERVPGNDILEVPSVDKSIIEGLPGGFNGDRGFCFVYNGPSPTDDTNFTEAEFIGSYPRPDDDIPRRKNSMAWGHLQFSWGPAEAILDAAKRIGKLNERPFVFGLNE